MNPSYITFECFPVESRSGKFGTPVYVPAFNAKEAEKKGRAKLRARGQRGRFTVHVKIYNPLNDPEMHGFVRRAQ